MTTPSEVRAALEKALRGSVSDREWDDLVDRGYLSDLEAGGIQVLAKEIQRQRFVTAVSPQREEPRPEGELGAWLGLRAEVLGFIFAKAAAVDPTVSFFRRRCLRGQVMDPREVGPWLTKRLVRDQADPTSRRSRRLECLIPDQGVRYAQVGGVLAELATAAEEVAAVYGWRESEAALFLLSGQAPRTDPIRARTMVVGGWAGATGEISLATKTRITLEVDPVVTPYELANAYSRLRSEIYARPDEGGSRRQRRQSLKHLRLASVLAIRPPGMTWKELAALWEEFRSEDGYSADNWKRFARDARVAARRLLEPAYREP